MKIKSKNILLVNLLFIFILFFTSCKSSESTLNNNTTSLQIYCGAGLQTPMEKIAQLYTEKTGVQINYIFNGSGTLSSQIKTTKKGDLYIPGDSFYVDDLKDVDGENYIYQDTPIAYHTPVVVVSKGKKNQIKTFYDLANDDVNIVLGDKNIAIGKLSNKLISNTNLSDNFTDNTIATFGTVNQVVLAVSMNEADAGIVWYSNYLEYKDKLEMIEIPKDIIIIEKISIGILNFSKNTDTATEFMNFVATEGIKIFKNYGYQISIE